MHTKTIKIISIITIASLLFACKGKSNESNPVSKDVKPLKTEIQGYLSDYLEIEDGNYQASRDKGVMFSWIVKVKVKAKKAFNTPDYGLKDGDNGPLSLDLYDDKGTPIIGLDNLQSSFEDDAKLLDILTKGEGDTWVTFTKFGVYNGLEQVPDNTTSFTINSEKKDAPKESAASSTSANDDNSTPSSDAGDKNFDKLLDDYESYTDQLISLMKKANAGDPSALTDYADALQKATDLDKDLAGAKNSKTLSTEQLTRMFKIEQKMLSAQMQLQNKK